jgi:sialate O-acetylesterase
MISLRHLSVATALFLWSAGAGVAAITLPSPFGEHMVLQQGVPVPIWGAGCPGGDNVTVSIAGQSVTTRSDWAGKWMVQLAPMKAGGPYQMLIEIGGMGPLIPSSAANSRGGVELNDVLIGDVWLAAGPSDTPAAQISDTG